VLLNRFSSSKKLPGSACLNPLATRDSTRKMFFGEMSGALDHDSAIRRSMLKMLRKFSSLQPPGKTTFA
jgi:hypothetical protein